MCLALWMVREVIISVRIVLPSNKSDHVFTLNFVGDLPFAPRFRLFAHPSRMESSHRAKVKTPPMVAISRMSKCVNGTSFWVISSAKG
mmetsp:Transcript_12480/g.29587  ORF Transcript_12480/g.29587 Transcript_12480/m.29587 type:complete len:88 (+) Transcript_12480:258-521(+)